MRFLLLLLMAMKVVDYVLSAKRAAQLLDNAVFLEGSH